MMNLNPWVSVPGKNVIELLEFPITNNDLMTMLVAKTFWQRIKECKHQTASSEPSKKPLFSTGHTSIKHDDSHERQRNKESSTEKEKQEPSRHHLCRSTCKVMLLRWMMILITSRATFESGRICFLFGRNIAVQYTPVVSIVVISEIPRIAISGCTTTFTTMLDCGSISLCQDVSIWISNASADCAFIVGFDSSSVTFSYSYCVLYRPSNVEVTFYVGFEFCTHGIYQLA